ncbi:hypothetical protein [Sporosarcina sp. ITBMC105]
MRATRRWGIIVNVEDVIFTSVFIIGIIFLVVFLVKIARISKDNRKLKKTMIEHQVDELTKRVEKLEKK